MQEIWKPIKNYETEYKVSNFGHILSLNYHREKYIKELKLQKQKNGYLTVKIHGKPRLVHRLVAETFIPNPEHKPVINHKNGIRTDNRVINLEWCSQSENIRHKFDILGYKMGKEGKNPYAKPVLQIKDNKIINIFESQTTAEKITGINHTVISNCCLGKQHTAGGYQWKFA